MSARHVLGYTLVAAAVVAGTVGSTSATTVAAPAADRVAAADHPRALALDDGADEGDEGWCYKHCG